MAITVQCPTCQRAYKVDEKLIGQRVKCKQCGNPFAIEPPPAAPIDPFAEPVSAPRLLTPSAPAFVAVEASPPPPAAPSIAFQPATRGLTSYISIERLIVVLLLLFVLVTLGIATYLSTDAFSQIKDSKIATGVAIKIWGWVAAFDLLFFLVLGPLMMLGVWGSTKVIHTRIGEFAYWRACAVVAVGIILGGLAEISPDLLKVTLLVLALPAMYYVLKEVFEFSWSDSGVSLAFGVGGLILGSLIVNTVLGTILTSGLFSATSSARDLALAEKPVPHADDSTDSASAPPDAAAVKDPAAFAAFKSFVMTKTAADISQSTREEHAADLDEMKRQQASLFTAFGNDPDWPDLSQRVERFDHAVAALPSAKFTKEVYSDSADAEDWTTGRLSRGRLGPEVSFRQFKLQPPAELVLDAKSSDTSADGLVWESDKNRDVKFSISTVPRHNEKQRKPVVSDKTNVVHDAQQSGLLAVDAADAVPAEGQVNGLTISRLSGKPDQSSQWFIPDGDQWLIISASPAGDPRLGRIMQAAARTIRETEPGEQRSPASQPVTTKPATLP